MHMPGGVFLTDISEKMKRPRNGEVGLRDLEKCVTAER